MHLLLGFYPYAGGLLVRSGHQLDELARTWGTSRSCLNVSRYMNTTSSARSTTSWYFSSRSPLTDHLDHVDRKALLAAECNTVIPQNSRRPMCNCGVSGIQRLKHSKPRSLAYSEEVLFLAKLPKLDNADSLESRSSSIEGSSIQC
jgi:hypothetical protein